VLAKKIKRLLEKRDRGTAWDRATVDNMSLRQNVTSLGASGVMFASCLPSQSARASQHPARALLAEFEQLHAVHVADRNRWRNR